MYVVECSSPISFLTHQTHSYEYCNKTLRLYVEFIHFLYLYIGKAIKEYDSTRQRSDPKCPL